MLILQTANGRIPIAKGNLYKITEEKRSTNLYNKRPNRNTSYENERCKGENPNSSP